MLALVRQEDNNQIIGAALNPHWPVRENMEGTEPQRYELAENVSFPAVLFPIFQEKKLVDKAWHTKTERKFQKGVLRYAISEGARPCVCYLLDDSFYSIHFGERTRRSVGVLPLVSVPVIDRQELPKAFIKFKYGQIKDYKLLFKPGFPRVVIKTPAFFLIIAQMSAQTFKLGAQNPRLVNECLAFYEGLGINHEQGTPRDDPRPIFAQWLYAWLQGLEKEGKIKRNPAYVTPACPRHRVIGTYVGKERQYFCRYCQEYYATEERVKTKAKPRTNFCPECGAKSEEEWWTFCASCGYKIE